MLTPSKVDPKGMVIMPSRILKIFEECEDDIIVRRKKLVLEGDHYSLIFQSRASVLEKIESVQDYTTRLKMEIAMSTIPYKIDVQHRLSSKVVKKLFVEEGKLIKPNGKESVYFVDGTVNVLASLIREKTFKILSDV